MISAGKSEGVSRPSRETRAEVTTREANRIIAAETKAREDKTARLRRLRLEQSAAEGEAAPQPAAPKPARRRTVKSVASA